jgi:hypothetical protein
MLLERVAGGDLGPEMRGLTMVTTTTGRYLLNRYKGNVLLTTLSIMWP